MFLPKPEPLYFVLGIAGETLSVVCVSDTCSVTHGRDFSAAFGTKPSFFPSHLIFRLCCYENTKALSKDLGLASNGGIIAARTSTLSALGFSYI